MFGLQFWINKAKEHLGLKRPSFQEAYCEAFRRKMLMMDYKQALNLLVMDLDDRSAKCARLIIYNLKHRKYKTAYTRAGRKLLAEIDQAFNDKIRSMHGYFSYDQYKLPINHFETSVFLYKHGLETIKNLESLRLKEFVDVGGFVGDSALVLSDYTDGKVHSFEPVAKNYAYMLKTIELNQKQNIVPVNKGLGKKTLTETIRSSGPSSSIKMNINSDYTETIQIITLDSYVADKNIEVGLIKVDIEGYESDFLAGARQTIKTQRPILLLSMYHSPEDFFLLKDKVKSIRDDYNFSIYKSINTDCLSETLLIAQ